ncbi:hypothetical protein GCM10028773_33230 [Spirosoma koreense]
MTKVAASLLLSASTLINPTKPTTPKTLSFEASAFVTNTNQIRVAVNKAEGVPVDLLLRDSENMVIFRHSIDRNEAKYTVKLNVDDLTDGKYVLEIKSREGSIRKQLNLSTKPVEQTSRLVAME